MSNLAERLRLKRVEEAHIKNSMLNMRIFVICILFISIYTYSLHLIFYQKTTVIFNIWAALISIFLLNFWLLNQYISNHHKISLKFIDYYIMSICLLTGTLLATGIFLIHFNLSITKKYVDNNNILFLSALLSISVAIISIAFLTLRLRYFFLLCFPIIIPILFAQLHEFYKPHELFYWVYDFMVLVVLICAYQVYKNHQQRTILFFRNKELIEDCKQQVQLTDKICQQLQQEMHKSKEIEIQLQMNNQLLEKKVQERIQDIQKINERLEHYSQNLTLAHEIAGIRAWNWDIANRLIEISSDTQHKNPIAVCKQHQYAVENMIHPEDRQLARHTLKRHLKGYTERFELILRIKNDQGAWIWVQELGRVILRDPKTKKPLRMVGMRRDIDQEQQDQEQLKLAANVLQKASEGIFILDENLHYVDANPYFEQMTGLSRDVILQRHLFDLNIQQQPSFLKITKQLLKYGSFDGALHQHYSSGREVDIWLHINSVKDNQARVLKYVGIASDHTERKRQEQRLSYLENYNSLTDLPNRMYYHHQLHQLLVNADQQPFAVIQLNIDRFRQLNELLGKQGADELLQQVAQRLRSVCYEARLLAYLNGNHFAILYDISHLRSSVKQLCERILLSMLQAFHIQEYEKIISLSIGIAYYPEHGRQIDVLNNRAELALGQAKRLGGNTVCDYAHDPMLHQHAVELEHELRKAILNHELVVYYQPKLCAKTYKIIGFEALVRWHHPQKGLLLPEHFIPLALQSSLISDIGRLVINQTVKQIQAWHLAGFNEISVSVNIVAQQINRGELLNDLETAMQKYPIAAQALELEITESSLIENSHLVKNMLQELKRRHIAISLDDFGTGYSSMAYLTEFPIDILKIDRSFIVKIGDKKQEAIIGAIIAMAKAIGLTIVAEGVETIEQAQFLKNLNCDILQGYLFSKPLSPEMSTTFLNHHQPLAINLRP